MPDKRSPGLLIVTIAAGVLIVGALVLLAIGLSATNTGPSEPAPRDPLLPDLVVTPMSDFQIGTDEEGNEALRFTATVANIGEGPLIVKADRSSSTSGDWRVVQWFQEPDGELTGRETGATLIFGGHGHEHWHIKFGTAYRLYNETGAELRSQTKAGYCWFDQVAYQPDRPDAPTEWVYLTEGCGTMDSTKVEMGMSVGWSDPYYWQLEDQSVDITGLEDGIYVLKSYADPDEWLREGDESNNETWTRLRIGTLPDGLRSVEVLDSAPAP